MEHRTEKDLDTMAQASKMARANKLIEKLKVKALEAKELNPREKALLRELEKAGRIVCKDYKWYATTKVTSDGELLAAYTDEEIEGLKDAKRRQVEHVKGLREQLDRAESDLDNIVLRIAGWCADMRKELDE